MSCSFEDLKALKNLKELTGSNSGIGVNTKHVFYRYKIHFIEKTVNAKQQTENRERLHSFHGGIRNMTRKIIIFLAALWLIPISIHSKQITPGVEITKDNYQEYLPDLKRLLDPATYNDMTEALKDGIYTLSVIKRNELPQHKLLHELTVKNAGTCRVGPDNELIGWKGGSPFPNPKTGAELCWNLDRREMVGNQVSKKVPFLLSKNWELERSFFWNYWNFYYTGRFIPPIPEIPGNNGVIRMKESFLVTQPFDIRGFCYIRTRYEDIHRPDDVYSFIPAIRRVRRLTGADVCDPLLGSDMIYDDFEFMRQKITPRMTFKMREQEMLVPTHMFKKFEAPLKGHYFVQLPWEIRTCYVLEVNINDPDYVYSKRVIYMEKQRLTGLGYYLNTYDIRGRLHRSELYWNSFQGPEHFPDYWGVSAANQLTRHHTVLDLRRNKIPDRSTKVEHFSFRWLLKQVR